MTTNRRVSITYCSQCRFVLRAGWMAQELLMTFGTDIAELVLIPATGGVFDVHVDGVCIFSRSQHGRFPESKEIKQLVRDRIVPGRDLGHSDRGEDA
jgi:selenoprotein W-related protein